MRSASSAQIGANTLGPPCARFFLRQYKEVRTRKILQKSKKRRTSPPGCDSELKLLLAGITSGPEAQVSGERVVGVWEITADRIHKLDHDQWDKVTEGAVRGALYENAIVDFWVDPEAEMVYSNWTYGPLYERGYTSKIVHAGDGIVLQEYELHWMS
jgi:hypothetical protein